jgi:hypothetical protein
MGIDAILRTETQEELASVSDPQMVLSRATTSGRFSETRLLKYLVPWGDAVFNQAQAPDLRDDIRVFTDGDPGAPLSDHLLEVRALVERLASETHSYLWFIGD